MELKKRRLGFKIEKNYRIENFLSNVVDEDIQTLLYPLNMLQMLVLNPKYIIKKCSIISYNRLHKLILICGMLMYLASYVYRLYEILCDENMVRYRGIDFLSYALLFDICSYCISFIINFILHFMKVKKNINFILTFQEVHRFLNNKTSFTSLLVSTWMYVIMIFVFYIMVTVYLLYLQVPWNVTLNMLTLLVLDSNIIYAIALMNFLTNKMLLWNDLAHSSTNSCREMDCSKAFKAYDQILKCYKIYKEIFKQPILYQTVDILFHSLVNVQILIEFLKQSFEHQVATPLESGILGFCMVKYLAIQLTLSLQFDAFYTAVKQSQDTCAFILASNCTDEQKRFCKNILRLHRASFSKMTACGLFYVDICQPLRLMALITNYTIVLLQFAFL